MNRLKMKFYKFCLIFLMSSCSYSAQIKEIVSLHEARTVLENLDENALVVFDVDETLIIAEDKIRRKNPEHVISHFNALHFDMLIKDADYKEHFDSLILNSARQALIEAESVSIINMLQAKKIKTIALTHMHAGAYGLIPSMEEWRFKQLYNLGINFWLNNDQAITFYDLPAIRNAYPLFYKGILVTARGCSKGELLSAFLNYLDWKPSMVVFFDDNYCHIESIDKEMAHAHIPCILFHYRATEIINEPIDFDPAAFQYHYLFMHEKWLSDVDAKLLMDDEKNYT
ncbi:MAG: DUF2608 domain-containing protein [Candidatus Babeliales bacterium]